MKLTKFATQILRWPSAAWQSVLQNAEVSDRVYAGQSLGEMAQVAAYLATYIFHRWNHVGGDKGHAEANRIARETVHKVREAMGFSKPDHYFDYMS